MRPAVGRDGGRGYVSGRRGRHSLARCMAGADIVLRDARDCPSAYWASRPPDELESSPTADGPEHGAKA